MRLRHSVLFLLVAGAIAPAYPASLVIAVDVSDSSAVATDEASAKAAAKFVRQQVAALKPGDFVHLRSFADRSSAHLGETVIRIDRRHPAGVVADQVANMIATLPRRPLKGAGSTNILAFFQLGSFDCANEMRVVALTDAIEASSLMSEKRLLSGKALPAPPAGMLNGCHVTFWGIGRRKDGTLPVQATMHLRDAWSAYFRTAGASFTPIDN